MPENRPSGDHVRERLFDRLYEDHVEAVRRYAWRRDPAFVDDIVAETFLVAWRRLDEVPASPRAWLIGVARNARLNLRRATRRQRAVADRLADTSPRAAEAEAPAIVSEIVAAALARLPERDREVLTLSVWDDLDRAAIAEALGCSRANVSVRLHRARRRFAAEVERLGAGNPSSLPSSLLPGGLDA
jgi:RNA polymerase sigma-70 factor (ECF subfamily)